LKQDFAIIQIEHRTRICAMFAVCPLSHFTDLFQLSVIGCGNHNHRIPVTCLNLYGKKEAPSGSFFM
jgi:hypothetical protein